VPDEKDQWPPIRNGAGKEGHKHSNAPAMRAQGAATRTSLYAKKRNKHAFYMDLPGSDPLRNVPINLASVRTEAGVARVFDFLDRLILAGAEVLGKYEQRQELHLVDVHILVAARQTALKFMDKTVPDVVTKQDPAPTPVQIVINAPLKRLQTSGQGPVIGGQGPATDDRPPATELSQGEV
jgi:hypothetical protein